MVLSSARHHGGIQVSATKSGIVIALALALLVSVRVNGQEASPSPEPSIEPSPSVYAGLVAESSAVPDESPMVGCEVDTTAVVAEFEALVAALDAETAAAVDDWSRAKKAKAFIAAADRLDAAGGSFASGVEGLDIPPEVLASFGKQLSRLTDEYARTAVEAKAGEVALDADLVMPKSDKAVQAIRSALEGLDPCAGPEPAAASPEATGAEVSVSRKSIDDLLATDLEPKGKKATVKAISDAFATEPDAEALVPDLSRKWVVDYAKANCPKNETCLNILTTLFNAYVVTGSDEFFVAAEMVWASSPSGGIKDDLKEMLPKVFPTEEGQG